MPMSDESKATLALVAVAALFLALGLFFRLDLWGHSQPQPMAELVDPKFTNVATVRMSAGELKLSGGDASGLDCYACHEKGKVPKITMDDQGQFILPEEHNDLVMRHGQHSRNIHCYNCHDPENLDQLKTREGKNYPFEQSTLLCASCHGPTYRDWEKGIHGRTSGFWDRTQGPATKAECASCHHPHAPAFPSLAPAPGPGGLYPRNPAGQPKTNAEGVKH